MTPEAKQRIRLQEIWDKCDQIQKLVSELETNAPQVRQVKESNLVKYTNRDARGKTAKTGHRYRILKGGKEQQQ